ncbi:MAG: DUF2065 domain-containing protein [Alphaproteobacteria bacterium]|nr:DUF2065 domain-containing protein [Alphaproteobacteria bacterium]
MSDFLVGLGLVFVIEGLIYALFPSEALKLYERLKAIPSEQLRMVGLITAIVGLSIVWLVRGA